MSGMTARIRFVPLLGLLFAMPLAAQDVPFQGIVVEDNVQVRAGAGRAYDVVGEIKKDTVVQVDEVFFGWNKIPCPQGVFSYISKAFVDAKGDGKTGVVNSDRTEVKAANVKGPGHSLRTQAVLNREDVVQIVAEEGSFYKIIPPQGTYSFLPPGSVRRISSVVAEGIEGSMVPAGQAPATDATVEKPIEASIPATDAVTTAEPTAADAMTDLTVEAETEGQAALLEQTIADHAVAATQPLTDDPEETTVQPILARPATLAELDQQMIGLFNLPVDQQPLDEMAAAYGAVDMINLSPMDQQLLSLRLATIERNQKLAASLAQIAGLRQQITQADAHRAAVDAAKPVHYDAMGKLMASSVYDGRTLPRMLRLVDATTGRTIAYVEPTEPVRPHGMLGQLVGIVGSQQYDPAMKLQVFEVKRIDVLQPTE